MENTMGLFPRRNAFDMSHERKMSMNMGKLVPMFLEEVLPGDTFKVSTDMLIRISPLLAPTMHRVNAFTHFFFVPNRLIWSDWESFITGGTTGTDASVAPTVALDTAATATGTLPDYFGIPPVDSSTYAVSALPFRAYALIYNEWYRDQNLQNPLVISKASGPDTTTSLALVNRNWEKDYFTSALPFAQRGTAVAIPLGTSAPVTIPDTGQQLNVSTINAGTHRYLNAVGGGTTVANSGTQTSSESMKVGDQGGATRSLIGTADLSTATAATVNDLRLAFQVQKWMERNARAGVRYVESILAHFGIRSSDARLQRPEFLGGGRSSVVISEVLQTSTTVGTDPTGADSPLGTMAGHAFSALRSHSFTKSFEEHGYIVGIMSIMPRTTYQQGVNRAWNRATRFDYFWPEFANLGEQSVLNKELYLNVADGLNNNVFGYQGRYDEYRRRESTVHGDFRTSLSYWHMGRIFGSRPALNAAFVTSDPTQRINSVTTGHNCYVQLLNNVLAIRPLPKTGEPGLIDHN